MKKSDAMQKINSISNLYQNNRNTHFANIYTTQFQNKHIWWTEVPTRKFSEGFYLLFCHEDNSLTLLKIPGSALNLSFLIYLARKNC